MRKKCQINNKVSNYKKMIISFTYKQTILKSLDVEDYHLKESISVKIVGAQLQEDILFNYCCACLRIVIKIIHI